MTPQLKSYYIMQKKNCYVLYRLFQFVEKNVILAFEYYLDEMSHLQLSGNARLMRLYLFLASNSCCFPYLFAFSSKALNILHAERIGHGYHVLEDDMLYRRIIDENIHLEVSYYSNSQCAFLKARPYLTSR